MATTQRAFVVTAGMLSVILTLALKPIWSHDHDFTDGMLVQSQNAANTVVALVAYYEINQDFPVHPRKENEPFAEIRHTPDGWGRSYWLRRYSRLPEAILVSYGRDGRIGGTGAKTDWVYVISMETNALARVSILSSPDPHLVRDVLLDTCQRFHETFSKPIIFRVDIPSDDGRISKLKGYGLQEQPGEQCVVMRVVNHVMFNLGEHLNALTLVLLMWVWVIAVFKNRPGYLVFVAVLSFAMSCMFYVTSVDGGHLLFALLGVVTLIAKKRQNQSYRWHLAFFIYTIILNIMFAIFI